jgi:cysteine synthase A
VPQQFINPDNPAIHYQTTAPEIWQQMQENVDVFISGMGSGGTLAGIGAYLKEKNPKLKLIAAEPKGVSALLGHGIGLHAIQGIGDGFIPPVLDPAIVDDVVEVTDEEAIETSRMLARKQGLLVGISAGANVWATMETAGKLGTDVRIATILPDRAERYFSVDLI